MIPGRIVPLRSGGVLVDVGDGFPRWFPTAGEARSFLLRLDLERAARPVRELAATP